jgi:hypothetical protein
MSTPEKEGAHGVAAAGPVEGEVAARLPVRALDERFGEGAGSVTLGEVLGWSHEAPGLRSEAPARVAPSRPGVGAALKELVPLADDLSAAIAGDDLARAKAALAAIGRGIDAARELPPGASDVVDLSAERARRAGRRKR